MPATNPKYIIYIIFDEPQGIKETYGLWEDGQLLQQLGQF